MTSADHGWRHPEGDPEKLHDANEVACQVQHDLETEQFGMKLNQAGPFQRTDGKCEYTYFPALTAQYNLCAERPEKGKLPSCIQVCQASCLQLLGVEEAARIAAANPKVLMMTL